MGLLDAILTRARESDLLTGSRGWESFAGGSLPTWTTAGIHVDEQSAMSFSAVWRAVLTVANTLASMPFAVQRNDNGAWNVDEDHPVHELLSLRPNPMMSASVFRSALQGHVLLWGNAYAEIVADGSGTIRELWPIFPNRVTMKEVPGSDALIYEVTNPDKLDRPAAIPPWRMLHIVGFSADGLLGSNPVRVNRDAIGAGLAAEQSAGRYFAQGFNPSGIMHYPGLKDQDKDKQENIRRWIKQNYSGGESAHRVFVTADDVTWDAVSTDPEKAQLLETRKFSVLQVSRVFGVPPTLLFDVDSMKWRNVEQLLLAFRTFTVWPWVELWEQTIRYRLFPGDERKRYRAKMDMDEITRADLAARAESDRKSFEVGKLSINDMLRRDGRNTIGPDGDIRFVPKALVPLEQAVEKPEPKPMPMPTPVPPPAPEGDEDDEPDEVMDDAQRELVVELLTRAIEKERNELVKARDRLAEKGDRSWYDRWAEKFYAGHRDRMADAMRPGMRLIVRGGRRGTAEALDRWVEEATGTYVASSLARARNVALPIDLHPPSSAAELYERFMKEVLKC